MFNEYAGTINLGFVLLLDRMAAEDWDLLCFLLGDGQ